MVFFDVILPRLAPNVGITGLDDCRQRLIQLFRRRILDVQSIFIGQTPLEFIDKLFLSDSHILTLLEKRELT